MINLQPTLIGKLVKIRPMEVWDLDGLAEASSDPKIWEQHPDPRRSEKQYFRQKFFLPALACKGALVFENLLNNNKICGSSRYYWHRPERKDIFIGYTFITRDCWGSPYNREIKHLMMNHVYQYVDTIYFSVGEKNMRSQAAMKKIGGRLLNAEEVREKELELKNAVGFQIKKEDFKGPL